MIKFYIMSNGYAMYNTKKYRKKYVHRIVWERFNGKIPNGHEIHHIDGNKLNNDISNLELVNKSIHRQERHPEVIKKMHKIARIKNMQNKIERKYKVKDLFDKGYSIKQIILLLNFGQTTVYRYLSEINGG